MQVKIIKAEHAVSQLKHAQKILIAHTTIQMLLRCTNTLYVQMYSLVELPDPLLLFIQATLQQLLLNRVQTFCSKIIPVLTLFKVPVKWHRMIRLLYKSQGLKKYHSMQLKANNIFGCPIYNQLTSIIMMYLQLLAIGRFILLELGIRYFQARFP